MTLTKLSVQSFRNLESVSLEFGNKFNVIHGDNAQGKTNLLESIFLLGTLKSFRMAKNSDLIGWEKSFSIIKGSVLDDITNHELTLLLDKGNKKVRIDQKTVNRVSDFFGILTVVLFAPEEQTMVRGVPDTRRRYLDRAIFAGNIAYLTRHHEYVRILKQRNSLLKSGDISSMEPWSEQLAFSGAQIVTQRINYLGKIGEILKKTYREISGTEDEPAIDYHSISAEYTDDVDENNDLFKCALARLKDQERHQRTTLLGPHRDDIVFSLNGKHLRHSASQGQQRCFILALKMAEIEYLRICNRQTPVLLLDDMTSELDRFRTENLLRFITERGMQVFITTTGMGQVDAFVNHDRLRTFHVKQGIVVRQT